jgi:chorismate lyase / 3-hydroxybenzoate synthase
VETSDGRLGLLSATVERATSLSAEDLAAAVTDGYRTIACRLTRDRRFPIRVWNFVPDIQGPLDEGDRYMAFNMGRFAAYTEWFGGPDLFCAALPTASAVGVSGDTLMIHVLAADRPGIPVENPRQTPAYRYSRRYGIRPPCFARATKFNDTLLIGGTASIVGEDSRHVNDLDTQTRETFGNMAALITSATRAQNAALARIIDLRVHVSDAENTGAVASILEQMVPAHCDVEFVQAKLCRPELLVEIEGRAVCN